MQRISLDDIASVDSAPPMRVSLDDIASVDAPAPSTPQRIAVSDIASVDSAATAPTATPLGGTRPLAAGERINPKTGQVMHAPTPMGTMPVLDSPSVGWGRIKSGVKHLFTGEGGRINAAADVLEGLMKAGEPLMVAAGLTAPVDVATAVALGTLASKGVEKTGQAVGARPDVTRLGADIAGMTVGSKPLREAWREFRNPTAEPGPLGVTRPAPTPPTGRFTADDVVQPPAALPDEPTPIRSVDDAQSVTKSSHQSSVTDTDATLTLAPQRVNLSDIASVDSASTPEAPAPVHPAEAPVPKSFGELPPVERRAIRQILTELENFQYDQPGRQRINWWEPDVNDAKVGARQPNAPAYQGINRDTTRTSAAIRAAGQKWVEGTGRATSIVHDIVAEARRRAYGDQAAQRQMLPPDAGAVEGEIYPQPRRIGKPDQAREAQTIAKLDRERDAMRAAYEQRFGRVYNADSASELLDVHEPDQRWQHHDAVRSSAGALVQDLYDRALAEPVDPAKDIVVFTGGGTGSGKSSALTRLQPETHTVLDSTLSDYASSRKNIESALRSGRFASVDFTYRDPIDAFVSGVLKRLRDPDNGRPVTVATHASTHVNAPKTVLRLADDLAHEFVDFHVTENGPNGTVPRDLEWLKGQAERYNDVHALRAKLEDALAAEVDAGRLTPDLARAVSSAERFRQSPRGPATPNPGRTSGQGPRAEAVATPFGVTTRRLYEAPKPARALPWGGGRPMSQLEAVERLRDTWGVEREGTGRTAQPVRVGKMGGRKALGLYYDDTGLIRLRDAGDLPTFNHELGHRISGYWFEQHGRPQGLFADELMRLGEETTPRGQSKAYQLEEGVANYFRTLFADPVEARQRAPRFSTAVDDVLAGNSDLAARIRKTQDVTRRWNSQPESIRAEAQTDIRPFGITQRVKAVAEELKATRGTSQSLPERLYDAAKWTGELPDVVADPRAAADRFITRWFDSDRAATRALRDVAEARGGPLRPTEAADLISKLATRSDGIAESMVVDGVRDASGQFAGPSVKQALSKVGKYLQRRTGELNLPNVLHALRAKAMFEDGKGRDPGLTRAQVDDILGRVKASPDGDALMQAADTIHRHERAKLNWMYDQGGLSRDQLAALKETSFYAPLQRVMDVTGGQEGGRSRTPIKRQAGSARPAQNPIKNLVRNTPVMVKWTLDNAAIGQMAKAAIETKDMGHLLVEIPPEKVPVQFNVEQIRKTLREQFAQEGIDISDVDLDTAARVFVPPLLENGKMRIASWLDGGPNGTGTQRYFQVQNEALWQWMKQFGPQPVADLGIFSKAGKALSSALRTGATRTLEFAFGANFWRDQLSAFLQSKYGFVPVWDTLKGAKSILTHDANRQAALSQGASFGSLRRAERRSTTRWIDDVVRPKSTARKVLSWTNPFKVYDAIGDAIESATRQGEFNLAMERQGQTRRPGFIGMAQRLRDTVGGRAAERPAAWTHADVLQNAGQAAQDVTLPFREGGTAAKKVNQYVPFFNAMLLGFREAGKRVARDPTAAALDTAAMSAMAVGLWWMNRHDPYYQQLSPSDKRNNFWFNTPAGWVVIPKPEGVYGATFTGAEMVLDALHSQSSGDTRAKLEKFAQQQRWAVFNFLPVYARLSAELQSGYDFYRDRPILSEWDKNKEPDLQAKTYTSDTARAIGRAFNVSPAFVDQAGYGVLSNSWKLGTKLLDPLARKGLERATGRSFPVKPADAPTQGTLGTAFGINRLVRPRAMSANAPAIQDFYDAWSDLQKMQASLRDYQRGRGTTSPQAYARELRQQYPAATQTRLKQTKQQIDAINDSIASIQGSRSLSAEAKRQQIDQLYARMVRVAQRGMGQAASR